MIEVSTPDYVSGRLAGTSTVTLTGELDMACSPEIREMLLDEISRPGVERVIVDLAEVTFIDSSFISALVAGYHTAKAFGAEFVVVNPMPRISKVLRVAGILDLLCGG